MMTQTLLLGLFIITAVILAFIGGWSYRNQDERGAKLLVIFTATTFVWTSSVAGQLVATQNLTVQIFALYVNNIATHIAWPTWIIFSYTHSNNTTEQTRSIIRYSKLIGGLAILIVVTNPVHHLVFNSYELATGLKPVSYTRGVLYYIVYAAGYGLLIISIKDLIISMSGENSTWQRQTYLILTGVLASVVGNLSYNFRISPVDTTPVGISIFAALTAVAVYRFKFLEITPIAQRQLFNEVEEGIIVADDKQRVTSVNDTAETMFGLTEPDVQGDHVETVFPETIAAEYSSESTSDPDDTPIFSSESSQSSEQTITELTTDDGTTKYYTIDSSVLHAESTGDSVIGTAYIFHDITQLIEQQDRLEEQKAELEQQKQELEQQNERLETFASTVSHDLRNPINVAQVYLGMAKDTGDISHLDEAEDSLNHMTEIVEDVLTLSREGKSIDSLTPVRLHNVVDNAWENVETGAAELENNVNGSVMADESRLQTIFENLFRNAVEHASDTVVVRVSEPSEGRGFVVTDNGPGIDEQHLDQVFNRGFTTNEQGTGFGLSIVSEVAEAHEWTVHAGNDTGELGGAEFIFEFPDSSSTDAD